MEKKKRGTCWSLAAAAWIALALVTVSDSQFDEATFEDQLTGGRNLMMTCWYWILKLKARFLSADYAEALEAAEKAKQLLETSAAQIPLFDYFHYTALTVAALYETGSANMQQAWSELLRVHQEQLREWAENNPPTFADKHMLVLAEIARLEKRDADALRLYEQAIHLARENGFVQNEGLAHELAGQYCLARNLEAAGYAYLRFRAELLRPLGRLRQGEATRRTLPAPA
jgi:tetratricopeptide (TPR) repeat protein